MERIQLKNPGEEALLEVLSVVPEKVDRTDYWVFQSAEKEIRVPASTVAKRLERMKLASPRKLVGKVVRFARSTKTNQGGVPYWEMDLATEEEIADAGLAGNGGTSAAPASGEKPQGSTVASPAATSPPKVYTDLYLKAMDFAINTAVPRYKTAGITLTNGEVLSVVATVFEAKVREA